MEIRVAGELRPRDVGRVVELHGALYALECGFDSAFEAYVAEPLARFVLSRTPRERLWLVEEGDALRGCLAIVRVGEQKAGRMGGRPVTEQMYPLELSRAL